MKLLDKENVSFKKNFRYILSTIILLILLVYATVFSDQLYGIFGESNYVTIHLMIELLIIIVTMGISLQVWLTSKFYLINKDIYMGALFFALALFEILHTISYKGMPFFITESSPYEATWFYMAVRLFLPIGLIIISMIKVKKVSIKHQWIAYSISLIIFISFFLIIYSPSPFLPPLVIEGLGTTLLKNILQFIGAMCSIVLIIYLLRHFKTAPRRSMLFITSSMFMIISDVLFVTYKDVFDFYNFLGHIFELLSFTVLYRAIYFSSAEEPFNRLIEANKKLETSKKEMYNMAYFDEITNLPNERFLYEKLNELLTMNRRQMMIVCEYDRLDAIKSSLGSNYLDKLLKMIAERIQYILPKNHFISKLRADQFAIFISENVKLHEVRQICRVLQKSMKAPFHIQHFSIVGGLKIGISQFPKDANNGRDLVKHAQFAMYEAAEVPDQMLFYDPTMAVGRTNRVILENDLHQALSNNELYLVYQPQICLKTREMISLEALIRWKHPERGIISPFEFIPIAEESGLIVPIGNWVLETACYQTKRLQDKFDRPFKVAVNLSLGQLFQENFVHVVQNILFKTQLPANSLELEITESMTMDSNHITPILHQLKCIGVSIALDDFGTGYSSLSYLKDFPIDCLKIDRTFVNNIRNHKGHEPIVDMILSMAKHLELKVVAEGIEVEQQLYYLVRNDCDYIQGYLMSKPLSFESLIQKYSEIQDRSKDLIDRVVPI